METYLIGGPMNGTCITQKRRSAQIQLIDRPLAKTSTTYDLILWLHPDLGRWEWCYAHPTWEFSWLARRVRPHLPEQYLTSLDVRTVARYQNVTNLRRVPSGCARQPAVGQSQPRLAERSAG